MKHHYKFTAGSLAALLVAALSAGPTASAQAVRRDTVPIAAQKPVTRTASVDSLVECSPVAAPVKKKPVVRRKAPVRKVASSAAPKATPRVKATTPRRPIVRRARHVAPKANPAASHSTTVVMCRPVRPMPELAKGTPTEQSVIPVPQLATNTPPPATPVAEEDGPPIFVSTAPGMPMAVAGGGRSWTPFALVPAIFVPFVHNGKTHNGATTPIDTTTTPPVIPPVTPPSNPVTPPDTTTTPPDTTSTPPGTPSDTTPVTPPPGDTVPVTPPVDTLPGPPIVPPTTVPEPSTLVLLGSGLMGLVGVVQRRRRK